MSWFATIRRYRNALSHALLVGYAALLFNLAVQPCVMAQDTTPDCPHCPTEMPDCGAQVEPQCGDVEANTPPRQRSDPELPVLPVLVLPDTAGTFVGARSRPRLSARITGPLQRTHLINCVFLN